MFFFWSSWFVIQTVQTLLTTLLHPSNVSDEPVKEFIKMKSWDVCPTLLWDWMNSSFQPVCSDVSGCGLFDWMCDRSVSLTDQYMFKRTDLCSDLLPSVSLLQLKPRLSVHLLSCLLLSFLTSLFLFYLLFPSLPYFLFWLPLSLLVSFLTVKHQCWFFFTEHENILQTSCSTQCLCAVSCFTSSVDILPLLLMSIKLQWIECNLLIRQISAAFSLLAVSRLALCC